MEDLAAPTRFIATHYALLGLLALISYAVGFRLTRRLVYHSLWEEISVCLGLGLGALAYLVFLLALVGVLYRPVVLLALAGLTLAAYPAWLQLARRTIWAAKRLRRSTIGVALFVLALSLPILLLPLYPPTLWDATSYHLAAAKIYVEHHQLVFTPNLRFPVFTQLNEMLFTLALLLSDDILAHLLEGLLLFTLLAALIGFGARFFSPRSGWWAAALLLANPLVLLLGSVAYVDIGLTLFATLAVFSFWTWLHTRQQLWLLLAAGFCGFALSTKYPALFFFAVFSLITLAVSWRRHQFLPVVLFGAIPLLIAAPWYIRIWYYTGNPVFPFFPFFYDIFGHRLWPADYVTGMLSDHSIYGTGKSLGALLMLPWNLAFKQEAFFGEGSFSPLYFFALPLLVIFGVLSSHIRALLLLVITYTLFWFFGPQVLRYLLPALPLLSLATAAALDCLLHWLPHSGRHVCQPFLQVLSRSSFKWSGQRFNALWHVKQPLLIGLVFLLLLAPGWHFAVEQVRRRGLPPMTDTQRDAYLTQQLGQTYLAYKFLNE
ncbi:MAG TPA: phospholipid carrier-dependent glycosyltransferase, partial [Dehalococcoidia bacterium]|nr:phospholipid carrier-dependent glycosyltransferase [Dehalococcoidia bacterium]